MLNAGKYKYYISIISVVEKEDEGGFLTKVETTVLTCKAAVKTTKGFTLITSNTDFEKAYTNFTIRFPKAKEITRDMLVKYRDKIYSIEYLNNVDEKNEELELQCKLVNK